MPFPFSFWRAAKTSFKYLHPSWTPSYASIIEYLKLDGSLGIIPFGQTVPAAIGSDGTTEGATGSAEEFVSPGVRGQAVQFNGNGYLIPTTPLDNTVFTFNIWVYFNDPISQEQPVIASVGGDWYVIINGDGTVTFADHNSNFSVTSTGTIPDNAWTMITCTMDNSNFPQQASIYINGALDVTAPNGGSFFPNGNPYFIGYENGTFLNGILDEMSFWSGLALPAGDILDLYNSGSGQDLTSWTSPTYGGTFTNYWPLDGAVGLIPPTAILPDVNGGNDMTTSGGSFPPQYEAGKVDQCILLDGSTNDIVILDSAPLRLTGSFTIAMWVRPAILHDYGNLLWKANYPSDGYGIITLGDGDVQFQVSPAGANPNFGAGTLVNGVWCHLVITWDGTTLKLYKNGVLNSSWTGASSPPALQIISGTHDLYVGTDPDNGRYFSGDIDEFAMWSVALPSAHVAKIYNRQL